jgi:hypothetical protein
MDSSDEDDVPDLCDESGRLCCTVRVPHGQAAAAFVAYVETDFLHVRTSPDILGIHFRLPHGLADSWRDKCDMLFVQGRFGTLHQITDSPLGAIAFTVSSICVSIRCDEEPTFFIRVSPWPAILPFNQPAEPNVL